MLGKLPWCVYLAGQRIKRLEGAVGKLSLTKINFRYKP
jgi:hypothetical protein